MTTVSNLPTVPSRGNPSTFSTLFEAFLTALKDVFVGEVNTVAGEVNTLANQTYTNAMTASLAAASATSSAATATSSANFKGNWSSLTGALNMPASVAHDGQLWLLNANIADVTTKTPGVASEWTLMAFNSPSVKAPVQAVAASDIDWSLSTYFTKTISGATTLTFSNVPTDRAAVIVLELTVTSGSLTLPAACKWPDDVAPTLAAGKTHLLMFCTDSGTSRYRVSALTNYTT